MAKGETYEVHELTAGRFVYHVWDKEGNLVDWWSKDSKIEDVAPEPGMDPVPTMVGEVSYHTEDEAIEYVETKHKGATCKTTFSEA